MNYPPHNRAFTLLELILVLIIICIGAAIAFPMLSGFSRSRRLPDTAQDFTTTARWCRVQAISDGVIYRLNLDVDKREWNVTKDGGDGNFVPVVSSFIHAEFPLPDGVDMRTSITPDQDGLTYISFDPGSRTDVGVVQFVWQDQEMDVACETPMASYHIVNRTATAAGGAP